MAPKRKDTEDTIDKRYTRRPQIVLRTLPPIVFTSPTSALAFQLTMSVSGIKPSRCTSSLISFSPALPSFPSFLATWCLSDPVVAAAPQLEGRPSYERDFGIGSYEEYAKPQVVKREFERANERVDEVKRDLKIARDTLDEKITGLETRLTAKIDAQKAYMDDKFEQQEKKFQERNSQLQLNLDSALDTHYESVSRRFNEIDKKVDERFAKVDERFSNVEERLDTIEEDIGDMKDDIKQIKQMLQHLLTQGGVPPTPLPSSSSQAQFLPNPPRVVVHSPPPPVAGPSSPPRPRQSSTTRRDAGSIDSRGSQREQLASVFRSIQRKVSRGFGLLNKSKERLDQ